jgi:hypothetical protein
LSLLFVCAGIINSICTLECDMESLKEGVWYPEMIMKDLVAAGLAPTSLGYDITDVSGRRFFYDRVPFAVVTWKKDDYMILAFANEFPKDKQKEIVKAFRKILEYPPFVQYESFQQNEYFTVFEWAKKDEHDKFITIMALEGVKSLQKIKDEYYNV